MGMESSKMYCPSRCRYRTYKCGAANYPVSWGAVQGPLRNNAKCNGYIKRKVRGRRVQKCIALVGADTVLTSAGP